MSNSRGMGIRVQTKPLSLTCFGQLSGAGISLARNLTELLPLAIGAVRLAFRAGILTASRKRARTSKVVGRVIHFHFHFPGEVD